jgi:valyl-tRNA synthetase
MPFVSEEIWQHLPHEGESLIVASWPKADDSFVNPEAVEQMNLLMDIIRQVRNIRAEVNVPLSKKIEIMIRPSNETILNYLAAGQSYIERFCNPEKLEINVGIEAPDKAVSAVVSGAEIYLPLAGLIDIEKELARLEKELANLQGEVDRVQKKLNNANFVSRAPEHVVNEERAKEKDYMDKRDKVLARINELKG